MKRISYEDFKELLLHYDDFNSKILNCIDKEFGTNIVNNYFEKIINDEDDIVFSNYIDVFLKSRDTVSNDVITNLGGVFGDITVEKGKYDIIGYDEERELTKLIDIGNKNLEIIYRDNSLKNNIDVERLYPRLNLGLIFNSVKDKESLELLNNVRRLTFTLKDDNIFSSERQDIKKFIKLYESGNVNKRILKKNFPTLDFENSISKKEIDNQLKILYDYVIAKNKIYNANIRLVISLAKRLCKNSSSSVEDKMQIGCLGLVRAINKFDYDKNIKMSTYATHWIKQKISRYIADNDDIIRKPVHVYQDLYKYKSFLREYMTNYGTLPSDDEVMEELNLDRNTFDKIEKVSMGVLSLDNSYSTTRDGDEVNLFEIISNDNELIEDEVVRKLYVEHLLDIVDKNLNTRDKEIFFDRIGFNSEEEKYTLEYIGRKHGLTRERIRQKENKILNRLKYKVQLDNKK